MYPLELHLADGIARAVPQGLRECGTPSYAISGVVRVDIDPTIPADLAAAGWYWTGSWLVRGDVALGMTEQGPRCCLADLWAAARTKE